MRTATVFPLKYGISFSLHSLHSFLSFLNKKGVSDGREDTTRKSTVVLSRGAFPMHYTLPLSYDSFFAGFISLMVEKNT